MMVDRKQAFKQKVLKKLYCSSPLEEKTNEAPAKKSRAKQEKREVERNKSSDAIGTSQIVPECRKVYTVSLPPSGYEVCATRPNERHEPQKSSEEESEERHSAKEFQRKHKRKRKFKSSVLESFSEKTRTEFQQPTMLQTDILQTLTLYSAKSETEMLTKNRRRKLKKKRHKEKLKAAGLVSKATAVELIYQPGEGSNDDVAEAEKAVEVIDLNAT
ncbi:glutamate-rich protein 1 isoform X2 [Pristis pectinata]|uniref:glutamate-rich protein 1 isoform X2 n=1 Tax=Pristis pectinata TaxID=685728 RepID=UPI00223CEAB0|nr:glutamate-rich protein 1 isoform X2 [Pristis pectinata]